METQTPTTILVTLSGDQALMRKATLHIQRGTTAILDEFDFQTVADLTERIATQLEALNELDLPDIHTSTTDEVTDTPPTPTFKIGDWVKLGNRVGQVAVLPQTEPEGEQWVAFGGDVQSCPLVALSLTSDPAQAPKLTVPKGDTQALKRPVPTVASNTNQMALF